MRSTDNKSSGNPLLVILFLACYKTTGELPVLPKPNIGETLQDFLSHLSPPGQKLLKKLAIALSAPFESKEKTINIDILLATIPEEERALYKEALKELSEMNIVHIKNPHLWMHDEIIDEIEKLLPKDEAIQQHYDFAQILKDKEPLGALWHLMKAKKANEAIELLKPAVKSSFEKLQILRFIQTFSAIARWFGELTRLEVKEDIRATYLFHMGDVFREIGGVHERVENCKMAIKAYAEALKVYTLERFPMDYAMTQNNLGTAYRTLAEVESKLENCKMAIKAYEEALRVFTKEEFPEIYPLVANNFKNLLDFCEGK